MRTPTDAGALGTWMDRALALALRARGHTAPNPLVGCVIVRHGRCVGEGFHHRAGAAHAEPLALAQAGSRARGADLFVTLEPCHHTGRTGPCTAAILAAGIARVFVAGFDPDVRVQGRGLRYLRAHGVEVVTGVRAAEAERLNAPYLHVKRTQRAYVVAKVAQSVDGCVATYTGESQWITNPSARAVGHALRARVDAIMVGRGTLVADNPRLTCRLPGGRDPARVVLASRADVALDCALLQGQGQGDGQARRAAAGQPKGRVAGQTAGQAFGHRAGQVFVVVGPQAPARRCRALERAGARIVRVPLAAAGPGLDLHRTLEALAACGLHAVLVEGGPTLLGSLFDAQLVQRLHAFVAPMLIGGAGRHSVLGQGTATLRRAPRLLRMSASMVAGDVWLRGDVAPPVLALPAKKGA